MNMSRRNVLAAGGKAAIIAMAAAPHASRAQSSSAQPPSAQASPDLIVHNAKVTTLQNGRGEVQAFAVRGYAVFQPNFRGSSGYGIAFRNAGFGQWGRKMQTDLSDGVRYLVKDL